MSTVRKTSTVRPSTGDPSGVVPDGRISAVYADSLTRVAETVCGRRPGLTRRLLVNTFAAAESDLTPPPASVLAHLASAPRNVFDRVGRWLDDDDPRRRAVAVAAKHEPRKNRRPKLFADIDDLVFSHLKLKAPAHPENPHAALHQLHRDRVRPGSKMFPRVLSILVGLRRPHQANFVRLAEKIVQQAFTLA